MVQCIALKPDGSLCKNLAAAGSDYCVSHDPDRAEARSRAASKAAKSKGSPQNREIGGLKSQLADLCEEVLSRSVSPGVGAVLTQVTNARIRLLETERKIRELDELDTELPRAGVLEDRTAPPA